MSSIETNSTETFLKTLYTLAKASSIEEFEETLGPFQKENDMNQKVSLFIETCKKNLTDQHLAPLLSIKERLKGFSSFSEGNRIAARISLICNRLVGVLRKQPADHNDIFRVLDEVPIKDREEIIKVFQGKSQDKTDSWGFDDVQKCAELFLRGHFIPNDLPILHELIKDLNYDFDSMLEEIDVIEKILPLCNQVKKVGKHTRSLEFLFGALKQIQSTERSDVIAKVLGVLKKISKAETFDAITLSFLIYTMGVIRSDQRDNNINLALSLYFAKETPVDLFAIYLARVNDLPELQREEMVQETLPLVINLRIGKALGLVFTALLEVPKLERASLVRDVIDLLKGIDICENELSEIFAVLRLIASTNPRAELIEQTQSIAFENRSLRLLALIFKVLSQTPKDERTSLIDTAKPLMQKWNVDEKSVLILELIRHFAPQDRKALVSVVADLLNQAGPTAFIAILTIYKYFPPENFRCFFEALPECPMFESKEIAELQKFIYFVFTKHPSIIDSTHRFLLKELQAIEDPVEMQGYASFIWDSQEDLFLTPDSPLAVEAISRITVVGEKNNPKNPFTIFEKLKTLAKAERPIVNLPFEEVCGSKVQFDLEIFQRRAQQKSFTFRQLSTGIGPNFLIGLFEAFDNRLVVLESTKKEEILKYIKDCYIRSYEDLKFNFVLDPFIGTALETKREPADAVSFDIARFFCILKYIAAQSNTPNQLLSEQEQALFSMSASIQECKIGKSEAISLAYNSLPSAYRMIDGACQTGAPEEEKVLLYLDWLVQKTLCDMLSTDNSMMKEMSVAFETVSQLSHHALYLKNLIAHVVGYKHALTFDTHTAVLRDEIVNRTLKEALDIFYTHFTPKVLIKALQKNFNLVRDDKTVLEGDMNRLHFYNYFNFLLEGKLETSKIWEIDENDCMLLSEEGALAIWKATKFIRVVSDSRSESVSLSGIKRKRSEDLA